MKRIPSPLSASGWMADLFGSKAARDGTVIRRKLRDIDRFVGCDNFRHESTRRGYHAVENAAQLVMFCNREPVRPFLQPFFLKENGPENLEFSVSSAPEIMARQTDA